MPTVRGKPRCCISLLWYRRAALGTLGPALLLACLFCARSYAHAAGTPETSTGTSGVSATQVLGLEGVKPNVKGILTAQPNGLEFIAGGAHGTVALASIQDIFTGEESRQVGGKAFAVVKMGVPYGGGRVISLFSHEKVDTLTLEYLDANGGFHGVVFTVPLGQAEILKQQLVTLGAHASISMASQPETQDAGGKQ